MKLPEILILVLAYLLGSIPFGYIITKLSTGEDITKKGSGNIGATNVLRTQGFIFGIITLILDALKAALPVILMKNFSELEWLPALAGGTAIVGHCYSIFLKFRGGKAAASGLGAFIILTPIPTLIALVAFIIVMILFGFVSIGSMTASFVFVISIWSFYFLKKDIHLYTCIIATLLSILLVYRHKSNIENLIKGKEKKVWEKDEH